MIGDRNKFALFFLGMFGLIACNTAVKPIEDHYPSGELMSLTYTPSDRGEGYKYIEKFDKQGRLIRRTEYLNDSLNGYDYVYYEKSNIITEYNYLMGMKHGVGRSIYGNEKISHETLFIHDTALIVLYSAQFYSDSSYNDLAGAGYSVYRDKGASRILSEKNIIGRLRLIGGNYVDVRSLRQEDIDKERSVWHYHNLPDSAKLNERIDFEIDLYSHKMRVKDADFLYGELYLGHLNTGLKLTDTTSVFTSSIENNEIIAGHLSFSKKGSNLVTGNIRISVLLRGDTAWTGDTAWFEEPFYKQIYVE